MARKRRNRSDSKKDDVRFIVIKPQAPGRMKLPGRLFQPERAGPARRGGAKALLLENQLPNLSVPRRFIATLIAAICFFAGLAMTILGVRNGKWPLVLFGPFTISYGIGWVWVAHGGRLRGGRLRLNPWDRG